MSGITTRIIDWIEDLPDSIRPAVYGSLFIVLLMLMKGAWLVAPIAILYVLFTSQTPAHDIAFGVGVVALAMLGGGLSGLMYGFVGRHIRNAFPGSRYLAGILTVAPYMFVLIILIRVVEHRPAFAPFSHADIAVASFMTLIFGGAMGHSWFGET